LAATEPLQTPDQRHAVGEPEYTKKDWTDDLKASDDLGRCLQANRPFADETGKPPDRDTH
jgi:hypothetical protein